MSTATSSVAVRKAGAVDTGCASGLLVLVPSLVLIGAT
jgi:hypothetical protein